MNKKLDIKTIVAIGIGAAVFMILQRFAAIPTPVPNTSINTAYAFLALMAVVFGPIAGLSIGFIGHTLGDLTVYGNPYFSWIIASAVFGLIIGFAAKKIDVSEGEFNKKHIIIFNVYQVIGNIVAWFVVAPALDIIIYAEPANKVFVQGALAGVSNMIAVGVLGTILLASYVKSRVKKGSLDREDEVA